MKRRHAVPGVILLVLLPIVVQAYLRSPALEELAQDADLVCVGTVVSRTIESTGKAVSLVKAVVKPEVTLKGAPPTSAAITVFTAETVRKKGTWVEDPIAPFPPEKSRVLLFLNVQDTEYVPVSPEVGVYLIHPTGGLRPKARFSLPEIEEFFSLKIR